MTKPFALIRFSYVAAPVLMVVYGSIRLLADTSKQPGAAWTSGHLAFLGALLLFGFVLVGLYRMARTARPRSSVVGLGAGLLGLAAFVTQAVIDLVVGFQSATKAEMSDSFDRIQDLPGMMPLVYSGVPQLLFLGLIALAALAATATSAAATTPAPTADSTPPVGWWRVGLVALGTVAVAVNLDLMPLGGVCYLIALGSLARPSAALPAAMARKAVG